MRRRRGWPRQAAGLLHAGLQRDEYQITSELGIDVLRVLANGLAPRNNLCWELLLVAPLALVGAAIAFLNDRAVRASRRN